MMGVRQNPAYRPSVFFIIPIQIFDSDFRFRFSIFDSDSDFRFSIQIFDFRFSIFDFRFHSLFRFRFAISIFDFRFHSLFRFRFTPIPYLNNSFSLHIPTGHAFVGEFVPVQPEDMPPGALCPCFRTRWGSKHAHQVHFCRVFVPGAFS